MKKIMYFLLFSFSMVKIVTASTFNKKRQTTESNEYGKCFYENENKVLCQITGEVTFQNPVIPEDIRSNITKFELNTDENNYLRPWLMINLDTFKRFPNLTEITIKSYMRFTQKLIDLKEELRTQFFNVPTVTTFEIEQCNFGMTDPSWRWVLPPNVEYLILKTCSHAYFDWTKPKKLQWLKINDPSVKLLGLPQLTYPTVQSLNTMDSEIILKLYRIAFYCNLTTFSFDTELLTVAEQYCECENYNKWKQYLKENNFTLEFWPPFKCSAETKMDCTNYTLEEAKKNRTRCLTNLEALENKTEAAKGPGPGPGPDSQKGSLFWLWIVILCFIVSFIFAVAMFVVEKYTSETPSAPEGKKEVEEEAEEEESDEETQPN